MSTGLPDEFGHLLTHSRSLDIDQLPDYAATTHSFKSLAERMRYLPDSNGPLDWTPCYHEIRNVVIEEPEVSISDEDKRKTYIDPLGRTATADRTLMSGIAKANEART